MRDLTEDVPALPQPKGDESTSALQLLANIVSGLVAWMESMLAGAMAGALAKTVIAPGDRVKIIFQADASRKFSFGAAVKVGQKIVEHSGFRGLWTGHGATLLRIMPYAATSYTTYDAYARVTKQIFGVHDLKPRDVDSSAVAARFFAGSAAGATATVCVYPLDLIRARYAAHWDVTKRYPSYAAAFRSIVRDEGWTALFYGLRPALIGIVPYAGITFATFETLKSSLALRLGLASEKLLSPTQSFVCGALAGLVGQSMTYPLDIVRRRMQVHPLQYPTMLGAFSQIIATEGVKGGLFKGLSMNWIKGPIAVGISFSSRDYFKNRIRSYHHRQESDHLSRPDRYSVPEKLLCGAVAGFVAKMWTLPFDRIRIMFTVGRLTFDEHGSRLQQIPKTMRRMMQDSPNFWQGSGAMMMRVVPYAAITYTTFGSFQRGAERLTYATTMEQRLLSDAIAGALAACCATMFLYPVELLHARTVAEGLKSPSYLLALKEMKKHGFRSMYQGMRTSIIGVAPTAGIGFALYHGGCAYFRAESFVPQLFIGTTAGAVAQLLTYPLNVARRTVQIEEVEAGILRNLSQIYKVNGLFSGLYRRMPLAWILSPTTVGLSFAVNDAMNRTMRQVRVAHVGAELSEDFSS